MAAAGPGEGCPAAMRPARPEPGQNGGRAVTRLPR